MFIIEPGNFETNKLAMHAASGEQLPLYDAQPYVEAPAPSAVEVSNGYAPSINVQQRSPDLHGRPNKTTPVRVAILQVLGVIPMPQRAGRRY